MSCQECQKAQLPPKKIYFVRVGNGNLMVIGCKYHVKELIDKLRSDDEKDKKE